MKVSTIFRSILPSARTLRLSTYLTVVGLGIGTLSSRALHAQVREAAFSFGRELAGLADLTRGAEVVLLNGERFHHAMTVANEPVSKVLDRVQRYCESSPGLLGQVTEDQGTHTPESASSLLRRGVIRDEGKDRGMVVCFMDSPIGGLGAMTTAIEHFIKTRNLSDFGRLRYTFAEQRKDGRTRVVTLWADTGLNWSHLFPTEGDAEGSDSAILPRPPGARRLLSASAMGAPFSLRLYRSTQRENDVVGRYAQWMTEHGWQVAAKAEQQGATAYLRKDGYQAIVTVLREADGTYVTLTESGRGEGHEVANVQVEAAERAE